MIHLVTGATGFIGSRLALELLRLGPDHRVIALARDSQSLPAEKRVLDKLREAASKYRLNGLGHAIEDRIDVVAGDFEALPNLPVTIDKAWHTAASLKFLDRDAEEIWASNVFAVENLVAWLEANDVGEINHVSTAYVAGIAEGTIPETGYDPTVPTNNFYEKSKRMGEDIVVRSTLPYRIMRPSIVVGDSSTFETMSAAGLYGFHRSVRMFKKRVAAHFGELFTNTQVNLITNPEARADFVTVDRCVGGMVLAGMGEAPLGSITHLTNPAAPNMADTLSTVFSVLGLRTPKFVSSSGQLSSIDKELGEKIDFYAPYIKQAKEFEHRSSVVEEITTFPIAVPELERLLLAVSR
ncbi:SDR family oxidoreductase [Leucobacter sp. M11]|uniref:SDR family oxidoreductase n=1 Tax=Leucobacter sp. M11 TaxID=2993565 RepID=UPI002D806F5A|nr:SDR family oxidoreductase [Leucobacter sp. M11]MEB4613737.1 SDR family oxidoreductase [Leucobacter sp. M11]